MKALLLAVGCAAWAALCWTAQAMPYRLRDAAMPGDQAVLAHKTSAYSDITWMAAASDDRMELRFFDRVEGGVCPTPSWSDLRQLAAKDPRLAHLAPANAADFPPGPADDTWPAKLPLPDPGTLTHTKYIALLPIGVLLNQRLMKAAGDDYAKAAPRILVVGFGSGIGIATLAHHFPQAAITVVDIDREVIAMVMAHYPLLRWLTTQTTATGEPRLNLVCRDARQYIRFDADDAARAGKPLDLIVFDAYTSGSTIPPHLMTVEFFAQCARALAPDGIFLANIIGSYRGEKRKVLGGAVRSLRHRDCGLSEVHLFPIMQPNEDVGQYDDAGTRNNIVVASRQSLIGADTWKRLQAFVPWPELEPGTYVTETVWPIDAEGAYMGSFVHWPVNEATAGLRDKFTALDTPQRRQHLRLWRTEDHDAIGRVRAAVLALPHDAQAPLPTGWDDAGRITSLMIHREDWVLHARETWNKSVTEARDPKHDGGALVGPVDDGLTRPSPSWLIADAPLFTDARPNADIFNAE